MNKLAINGGRPVRSELFTSQNTIGPLEIEAANRVLKSGKLTGYQATCGAPFYGGPEIRALEDEWCMAWGSKHAIAINSCTSALVVACAVIGLKPGDEVIVTPFSMTCSATAPMAFGAVPVFADIRPDTFDLDAASVRSKITPRTKAIIVVSLFGQCYDVEGINAIAKEHNLVVIEDAAQAVGAFHAGKYAGTHGHIGCYSFNLGKHLTCGEGGMIVTDNPDYAHRARLIMNHGEAVNNAMEMAGMPFYKDYKGMLGWNLRMTEVQAAIARVQLARRTELIGQRQMNAQYLRDRLAGDILLKSPYHGTHTHYVLPMEYHAFFQREGIHRDKYIKAVKAELAPCKDREHEGVPIGCGYIRPIYQMPLFASDARYHDISLPNVEVAYKDTLVIIHRLFGPNATFMELNDVVYAFEKVYQNRGELL